MFGLSKLWTYLAVAGAAIAAFFSALLMARREGRQQAEADRTAKAFEQSKDAREIDKNVHRLSDADLAKRLHHDQRD
jgi:hypothetical protein